LSLRKKLISLQSLDLTRLLKPAPYFNLPGGTFCQSAKFHPRKYLSILGEKISGSGRTFRKKRGQ